jgi:hypothetical protein
MARDLQVICYGMYIDQGKHLFGSLCYNIDKYPVSVV